MLPSVLLKYEAHHWKPPHSSDQWFFYVAIKYEEADGYLTGFVQISYNRNYSFAHIVYILSIDYYVLANYNLHPL